MVEPIRPQDVAATLGRALPSKVIETWNTLITRKFSAGSAIIHQDEAVKELCDAMECTSARVYQEHWLDIEELFRSAGWKVSYDKPGFNETYEARFRFSPAVGS